MSRTAVNGLTLSCPGWRLSAPQTPRKARKERVPGGMGLALGFTEGPLLGPQWRK